MDTTPADSVKTVINHAADSRSVVLVPSHLGVRLGREKKASRLPGQGVKRKTFSLRSAEM
ncbi:hypothetical protein [Streptomyces lunaelactis]|uniref:hypothetical protein n=1 Tax=Streptomyces lunaelactis TaxID=1535768 RepID=UPI001585009C|nr:hypothetical protein [Streptomyces lunaelactis]NUK26247.1 hypothetical protein [Streptomyces lunaelactis]